jgi:hypothetical protein
MVEGYAVSLAVRKEELEEVFAFVTPFIESIIIRLKGETDSIELIREMLRDGTCTLHFVGNKGFVILQWLDSVCHVRCASTFSTKPVNRLKALNAIKEYVAECGYKKLTFTTARKGLGRAIERLGATVEKITYKVEL